MPGYSGTVSFSDTTGHRVWVAWAVTDRPVKITRTPKPGDTIVCGKAPPNSTVTILDVTSGTLDTIIGTGTADAQGNFCVTVTPLYDGQVIMAEAGGVYSQPVVVRRLSQVFLPFTSK